MLISERYRIALNCSELQLSVRKFSATEKIKLTALLFIT